MRTYRYCALESDGFRRILHDAERQPMPRIAQIYIYPVKSCRGIGVDEAEISPRGFLHDREFLVVDSEGRSLTQRTTPKLALVETALHCRKLLINFQRSNPIEIGSLPRRIALPMFPITPLLHYSITPLLHYSITPLLHYSTTPLLHYSTTPLLHSPPGVLAYSWIRPARFSTIFRLPQLTRERNQLADQTMDSIPRSIGVINSIRLKEVLPPRACSMKK